MLNKLHLGCGSDIKEGYVNADFVTQDGVDVQFDFNDKEWPFEDNTFDEVYTSHTLEHIDNLQHVMSEIRRVCKPFAKVEIRVPHFSCGVGYRDPTHRRLFSYFTFDYFTYIDNYYQRKESAWFWVIKRKLNFTRLAQPWLNYIFNPIINLSPSLYERFFCWMLPCSEVLITLGVIKK